ncbi:uncharacterized protein ISCGN_027185 [Ixodes scapularis]
MLAWRTRYCCFGCTVKEGTLVVGIAIIVLRIINLIFISLGYSQLDEIQEEASYKLTWLPTLFVTGMVDCVVEIVACILLVKAASDDNRYLLIPWLVYNSLCIISHVVGAIHFFFVSVYVGLGLLWLVQLVRPWPPLGHLASLSGMLRFILDLASKCERQHLNMPRKRLPPLAAFSEWSADHYGSLQSSSTGVC